MIMKDQTVTIEQVMSDVDYIICLVLEDNTLKFAGQGLKWRASPLHPRGWKKLTTAQGYGRTLDSLPSFKHDWKIREVRVCERRSDFRCLSSYAITKQNQQGKE